MNKELYMIINKVKEKPGLYIGEPSLSKLYIFILGYIQCMRERDKDSPEFLSYFQNYIEVQYKINKTLIFRHWSDIILFFNANEEEAFFEFYVKMEEYLNLSEEKFKDLGKDKEYIDLD